MIQFILILLFVLFVYALVKGSKPVLQSHWNTLLDNFKFSTKEFYELLTKELQSRGVEGITIIEKELSEGNALSTKRLYLRVKWKSYAYDCCFAPFGNGSFVSWWLFSERLGIESLIAKIPFAGNWLVQFFFPITYYKIDTASMFMTYAQSSVLKIIDDITKDKGVRAISEQDRKPIMKDIFKR